jgi:prepilin-type N-terminal cleavage/methylation domain-containing protein
LNHRRKLFDELHRVVNMRKRGFTLLELIVVALIIAILAAILLPVYKASVAKAKETTCKSQLHQIQLGLSLYRSDNGGDGRFGRADLMGLPPSLLTLVNLRYVDGALKNCKGDPTLMGGKGAVYITMWAWPEKDFGKPKWEKYSTEVQEASILLIDPNHGNEKLHVGSPYFTHHVLGVYLDGQVVRRSGKGVFTNRNWWDR